MSEPALKQSTYLPTLDGWRALSIMLVILHHSQIQLNVPVFGTLLQAISKAGEVGVELFFGISGLLICSRLLEEETRFGHISVKSFYLRRCFRILPAALFYLLVLAILAGFHVIRLLPLVFLGALSFFLPQLRHGVRVHAPKPAGAALVHRSLLVVIDGGAFLPGTSSGAGHF